MPSMSATSAHGRLGQPALVLLLRPPQQRDDGRGLLARRILGDRRLGPGRVLRREGEAGGLMRVNTYSAEENNAVQRPTLARQDASVSM